MKIMKLAKCDDRTDWEQNVIVFLFKKAASKKTKLTFSYWTYLLSIGSDRYLEHSFLSINWESKTRYQKSKNRDVICYFVSKSMN